MSDPTLAHPIRIVLVETSHPGNIGSSARAMKTMGLRELCLVAPKHFPHEEAAALASGATDVLDAAVVTETLNEALAESELVFGLTARERTVAMPQLDPRQAMALACSRARMGKVSFVFGNERTGLLNEELSKCHYAVHIPANPEYSSLNLAAAVQVVCYEWMMASRARIKAGTLFKENERDSSRAVVESHLEPEMQNAMPFHPLPEGDAIATMAQLEGYFEHLHRALAAIDFFKGRTSDQIMQRLRRLYLRANLTDREVLVLRGILSDAERMARLAQIFNKTQSHQAEKL